jgi:hypothetical protein
MAAPWQLHVQVRVLSERRGLAHGGTEPGLTRSARI